MNYIEISIEISKDKQELSEVIIAYLADIGFESFAEKENILNAYILENLFEIESTERLLTKYGFEFTHKIIEQQNWNKEWEENFQPIIIDKKLAIKAPFHTEEFGTDHTIIIEPKMSFGTGHHATTHMMCKLMGDFDFSNSDVLDMGCGTGILAIYSSVLGAKSVFAIDVDEWSYENTIENTSKNNIENIITIHGNASSIPIGNYDYIFANINLNILKKDIHRYSRYMKKGSRLLLSGFFAKEINQIKEVCEKDGLLFVKNIEKDEWTACVFEK